MTRYFYDTEFHEDGKTIDLISIGIAADDGREYYAIHAEADWTRASAHPWLPDNVLKHLPGEWAMRRPVNAELRWAGTPRPEFRPDRRHKDVKVREQIAEEVAAFLTATSTEWRDNELWAYFAAYDHVVLCQLWGTMMDLPTGVPMFTNDLQQVAYGLEQAGRTVYRPVHADEHHALGDARWNRTLHREITRGTAAKV